MISPEPATSPSPAGTVPVPLAALAIDGVMPAEGDPVSFSVAGRIVSTDGTTAQVQVETVNDQPMPANDDAALMDAAMQADAKAGVGY